VVVVVPDDELLDESSFLGQEMMVWLQKNMKSANFIKYFSSFPQTK